MNLSEAQLHSFIIKIWVEDAAGKDDRDGWSGQIRHVPGGDHRYIKNFDELTAFIRPYLTAKKPQHSPRGVSKWIKRLGIKGQNQL